MIAILKHNFLNLRRHMRRSLFIISILAVGVSILFLINSFRIATNQSFAGLYRSLSGVATFTNENERIDGPIYRQLSAMLAENPDIVEFSASLELSAMLGNERDALFATGIALDLNNPLLATLSIVSGKRLSSDKPEGLLLHQALADSLQVKAGDWLTWMGNENGSTKIIPVQLQGIFSQAEIFGSGMQLLVSLPYAQQWLDIDGVGQINSYQRRGSKLSEAELLAQLRSKVEGEAWPLTLRSWQEVNPFYGQIESYYAMILKAAFVVMSILAALAIFAMFSLSLMERMKELGSMRAVGCSRLQLFLIVLNEVFLLGLLGVLLGCVLSYASAKILNVIKIPFTPPGSSSSLNLYFPIELSLLLFPTLSLWAVSLVAGLLPAINAARRRIVQVLYHI